MTTLSIHIDGDNCWPDLAKKQVVVGDWASIARLEGGTSSGASSVTLRVDLPDGTVVLAQTTLALLDNAVRAFRAAEKRG